MLPGIIKCPFLSEKGGVGGVTGVTGVTLPFLEGPKSLWLRRLRQLRAEANAARRSAHS